MRSKDRMTVCMYSNSRNDVPQVAQPYGTIAAHTRRRASCVCSVLRAVHRITKKHRNTEMHTEIPKSIELPKSTNMFYLFVYK